MAKLNFPDGTPHVTLYDGKSQEFATKLRNVLAHYDFECWTNVTKLRSIQKKFKVDEVFHASFEHFLSDVRGICGRCPAHFANTVCD